MFAKLLAILAVAAATACTLLVIRHARLEAANRTIRVHQHLLELRQDQWRQHSDIASRTRPEEVRAAITELGGGWSPILVGPVSRYGATVQDPVAP